MPIGYIIASHADANLMGGQGNDTVGVLAGINSGNIAASYATGRVNGGGNASSGDKVGGLVGEFLGGEAGAVIASYARVAVYGGDGAQDRVGGLIGSMGSGTVRDSYATGNAYGGDGNSDSVGGLIGWKSSGSSSMGTIRREGTIMDSYAIGNVDGGDGTMDSAGTVVGNLARTITRTQTYGFGRVSNNETRGLLSNLLAVRILPSAAPDDLTATRTGWNTSVWNTSVWNFATAQYPAPVYADYDGATGDVSDCSYYSAKVPGTNVDLACGTSNAALVGNFRYSPSP